MTTIESTPHQPIVWQAPDADVWELETAHGHSMPSVMLRSQLEEAFAEGFRYSLTPLGVPLSHAEMRHVNGWPYISFFLHDVPRKGGGPPPAFVLKAITRLHPGFRRRTKIARTAIAERRAQSFATDWFAERDQWIGRMVELQRDDLDSFTDQQLADHARAVCDLAIEAFRRHFELVAGCIPVGQWLHQTAQWGLDPADSRRAIMHDTPVHTEASERVQRIADAIGNAPFTNLEDIRTHSTEAANALDEYLTYHGWWATEDKISARPISAFPDSIIANIRSHIHRENTSRSTTDVLEMLRTQVSEDDRAEFDQLAQDAHLSYTMIDDNSGMLGSWAAGLTGHVLRAVSHRLAALSLIHEPDHLWALELDEAIAMLEHRSSLSPEEATVRYGEWTAQGKLTPPPHLNGPPGQPPDPSLFPSPVAQLVTALTTYLADKFNYTSEAIGIGTERVRGRAVVAADASDAIDRIEPGDILVTGATTPAYNAILPMVAGIIVTDGGASCHTAIVARELELPAIVGYADALATIPDGATIELDPEHATVRILESA